MGPITGMECLAHGHQMISCGQDGTLRVWDYLERTAVLVNKLYFSTPLTSLSTARKNVVAVGCDTGVLRVFQLKSPESKRGI